MAQHYGNKFEVVRPSLDALTRMVLPMADTALLDPTNAIPLIAGEFLQINSQYQWMRAASPTALAFCNIEDQGDYGVQGAGKVTCLAGGTYEANTLVFDTALTTLGAPVMLGTVNNDLTGEVDRSGLIAHTGTNLVIGFVSRVASNNGNKLRFFQNLV